MVSLKLYHDTRKSSEYSPAPIRFILRTHSTVAYIPTGVSVCACEWDAEAGLVVNRRDSKSLNTVLSKKRSDIEYSLLLLDADGKANGKTAAEIRDILLGDKHTPQKPLFVERFSRYAESRERENTRQLYRQTLRHMRSFCGDVDSLSFEDITKDWLADFDRFLSATSPSPNARGIYLRNIRAVFNDAIDNEVTTAYPFRRFKIKTAPTAKRSLSIERLRELFAFPVEPYQKKYVDAFRLSFFLCGINIVDLLHLREIREGRIEYRRAKTGRLYSVKVEREAMEIIDEYRGRDYLLNFMDTRSDYVSFSHRMDKELKRIGCATRKGRGGKKTIVPAFPELSAYWARHSWATIAASLDIPKETIAAALGHGGRTVTDIYIDFDMRKVDRANRRVIDCVLYGNDTDV